MSSHKPSCFLCELRSEETNAGDDSPEHGQAERPQHQGAPQVQLRPLPHVVLAGEHQGSVQATEHEGLAPAEERRHSSSFIYNKRRANGRMKKHQRRRDEHMNNLIGDILYLMSPFQILSEGGHLHITSPTWTLTQGGRGRPWPRVTSSHHISPGDETHGWDYVKEITQCKIKRFVFWHLPVNTSGWWGKFPWRLEDAHLCIPPPQQLSLYWMKPQLNPRVGKHTKSTPVWNLRSFRVTGESLSTTSFRR